MTQKGSIEKIVATAKMEGCKPNKTPALQTALGLDAEGKPWDQNHWDHASVVGMLPHVSNNTRPDIAFAVSQVARCTACPNESHARAIKCIIRHLAGTVNRGATMKHNGTFDLKVWADADFAGTCGQKPSGNAKAAKSRCGHVVTFGGAPLVWKSQLISETCLSATHAECVGLSNSVRALIPIQNLINDTLEQLKLTSKEKPKTLCKVFEDNQAACHLAINQQLSPRTKHFAVKHHFFWQFVCHERKNPDKWLNVEKCSTDLMNANCLAKGLGRTKLKASRFRTQGW